MKCASSRVMDRDTTYVYLGAEDGEVQISPISSIKKCLNGGKVVQVYMDF